MKINSQEKIVKELLRILSELNLERKKGIHEPYFNKKESVYVQKSINSTYVSTVGDFIKKFENEIKKFTKSKYAVATVNGTSALHISMMTLGIGPNHEVLIPNLNYIGSSNATIYCGASPHFVDVDSKYLGIDTNKLRDYLKRNTFIKKNQTFNKKTFKKIIAIAPTHIFGQPSKMNEILDISKEFNLKIVEDAAESLGSFYKHKHTGTIGDVGILSFNGNKIITTGGGGMILTNNFKIYNQAKFLSQVSKKPHPWKYDYKGLGFNYRMPNLNAALGYAQIKKLKNQIAPQTEGDLKPDHVNKIAEKLDVSEDEVISMNRRMSGKEFSLNTQIGEDGDEWQDWLVDKTLDHDLKFAHQEEMKHRKDLLKESIKVLNDREKEILYSRRLNENPTTLEDLSKKYKISRERVRQIENKAFEKLQKHMLVMAKSKNLLPVN